MPTILAFQLSMIGAAGALVMQSRKYRRSALLACFCMSISALVTFGSVYQLFAQVAGLAGLCAAATVLMRRFAGAPRSERLLAGLLLASLGLIYPEVLPFLAISASRSLLDSFFTAATLFTAVTLSSRATSTSMSGSDSNSIDL